MAAIHTLIEDPRAARLLTLLRREGPLSRQDLHERTSLRPNTVGELAEGLLAAGLLHEGRPMVAGRGRPRVPLDIDPRRRRVLGIALEPGRVTAAQFNLRGELAGERASRRVKPTQIVGAAADLVRAMNDDSVLAIGLSTTGFVDLDSQRLLTSSTTEGPKPVSLGPVYAAAGKRRIVVENDLQALAVQWVLTHEARAEEDILLVFVRDGAIGAAVLVDGRPIKGCVMGGNELGHTRLPIATPRCYCGGVGCLERIVSTPYLQSRRRRPSSTTLAEAAAAYGRPDAGLDEIIDHLAMAIANTLNLLRPGRMVLASEFNGHEAFTRELLRRVREGVMTTLASRIAMELWDRPTVDFSQAAAWLALASIYRQQWLLAESRDVTPARANGH